MQLSAEAQVSLRVVSASHRLVSGEGTHILHPTLNGGVDNVQRTVDLQSTMMARDYCERESEY